MKNHFFPGILTPCASTGAAPDLPGKSGTPTCTALRRTLAPGASAGECVLASGARGCAANLPCGHDVANFRELVNKFV
ncbi:MAG TPA: hypothetical protein VK249_17720 [Anaerolineales bacterium]|nr:hypothetical protein [Anaerolineales bacterium]